MTTQVDSIAHDASPRLTNPPPATPPKKRRPVLIVIGAVFLALASFGVFFFVKVIVTYLQAEALLRREVDPEVFTLGITHLRHDTMRLLTAFAVFAAVPGIPGSLLLWLGLRRR